MQMEVPAAQLTSWSILPVQADAPSAPSTSLAMGSTATAVPGAHPPVFAFGKVEGHGREVMGGREPLLPTRSFNRCRTYSSNGYL